MFSLTLSAQHRLTRTISYVYLGGVLIFAFFPLLWMLSSAVKPIEDLFVIPPQWIPLHPTLSTLNSVIFGDFERPSLFPTYFKNSLIVTLGTTILALSVSTLAGYALSRYRFRGGTGVMMSILSVQMFPQGMLLISLYLTFQALQMLNTYPLTRR
jgi:ABC-type glycerol-3-phosphate transport system permease component